MPPMRALVVATWVGCSAPVAMPPLVTPPAPLGVAVDAPAGEPEARELPDDRYAFEWQELRDDYEAFRKSPVDTSDPCDIRRSTYRQTVHCPGPNQLAGLVPRFTPGRQPRTAGLIIDRGLRDLVTTDWTVALLDDRGHPLTPWAPVLELRRDDECYAEVEIAPGEVARHRHVGMRADQTKRDAKLRAEGRM
jgi:hypothetical protein